MGKFAAGAALLLISVLAGCTQTKVVRVTETAQPPANTETTTTEPANPTVHSRGVQARDGGMEFAVKSIVQAPTVSLPYLTYTATGVFMVVELSVTNVGREQGVYQAINQKLIVGTEQYSYAGEPTFAVNHNATAMLNPGLSVTSTVVFDIPKGLNPTMMELHSDQLSPGVYEGFR